MSSDIEVKPGVERALDTGGEVIATDSAEMLRERERIPEVRLAKRKAAEEQRLAQLRVSCAPSASATSPT
jgi:hypothetical protein